VLLAIILQGGVRLTRSGIIIALGYSVICVMIGIVLYCDTYESAAEPTVIEESSETAVTSSYSSIESENEALEPTSVK